ncbi:D-alanyl-D-alanine carboxypeptidase/D-alanyl-D-alanine-endopeptidase [Evansella tamaricis]|uniref:D-alanyl-D-alanine carboxypeptidase/D-alanyl-D-alanine-endopeptidase n=1 Tax=Evansella tamaricis TaxID=2069301 RepID=A0ABS6JJX8_9BACI|nr:D-alanyl-D-alanine carboxypeptidase/D-alanyl-D-alanine-endopeptidase [Evansella tamaricis]MBU9713891.1 D-alanyl-D-alanine carboxypeptidase/D-alanyl-D-alanine-endopeptidase [Evansella tamaricis]
MKYLINLTIIILCLLSHANVAFAYGDSIQVKLTPLLEKEESLQGAIIGISVRSASNGELLFEHSGDVRLQPASNLKLFTAAVALSTLGENHSFKTEIWRDGNLLWKVLNGNLYLKGKGDPTLTMEDLNQLVKEVKGSGISFIRGDVIVDDTWYDSVRYPVDLPWSDETYDYGAAISALSLTPTGEFDPGCVVIEIEPGDRTGEKGKVTVPLGGDMISVTNETETVDNANMTKDIMIERLHGTNKIRISGQISRDREKISDILPVWDPTDIVSESLLKLLKENKIIVAGEVRKGKTPKSADKMFSKSSIPLREMIIPFMKYSINSYGEILVKEMGKQLSGDGSWLVGLPVMEKELKELGVNTETMTIRDGSGISHLNLVPPNEVTNLLYLAQGESWFPMFYNSLPVAGIAEKRVGGTLRNRLKEKGLKGKVIAKTGSLTGVSSIAGYAEMKGGEKIIFSVMLNHLPVENSAKDVEDQIISLILDS